MDIKPSTLLVIASVFTMLNLPANPAMAVPQAQAEAIQAAAPQVDQVAKPDKPDEEDAKEQTKSEESAEPILDTSNVSSRRPQYPEKFVRFHMWDGSIISGEVKTESVSVKTDFGPLIIPIARIQKIHPGLQSLPTLSKKISKLVEGLGDKDFDVREKSQRSLAAMGTQIRSALDGFDNGGSAERKKRLNEVKAVIDEIMDEVDENGSDVERALVPGDTIVTPDFSIVGKIQHPVFKIKNKFGELQVPLEDIQVATREFKGTTDELRKTISVGAMTFFQKNPVSTKVRVNVGDQIRINSDGTVRWTNWNVSSTPDGIPNQGSYQSIQGGTLCARIGTKGSIIKIGSECEFVAKKSGVLYLAIAMQDNYAKSKSYRWTGEYKSKIRVMPVEK